jgi:hypothetical protein
MSSSDICCIKTTVSGCDLWLVTFPSMIIAESWAMTQISLPLVRRGGGLGII